MFLKSEGEDLVGDTEDHTGWMHAFRPMLGEAVVAAKSQLYYSVRPEHSGGE